MKGTRHRRGAAAIEFALLLPLYLAMIMAVVEYGWLMSRVAIVQFAAEEGARAATGVGLQADYVATAEGAVRAALNTAGVDDANATVTTVWNNASPGTITVTVILDPYASLTGMVPTPTDLTAAYQAAI